MPKEKVREEKKPKKEKEDQHKIAKGEKERLDKLAKKEKERQAKLAKKALEKWAECPLCFGDILRAQMDEHLREEHDTEGDDPLICVWPDCGMDFRESGKKRFALHMRSHTHPEAHRCTHFHPTSPGLFRSCSFVILDRVGHGKHHKDAHGVAKEELNMRTHTGRACPCLRPRQDSPSTSADTISAESSIGGDKETNAACTQRPKAMLGPVPHSQMA